MADLDHFYSISNKIITKLLLTVEALTILHLYVGQIQVKYCAFSEAFPLHASYSSVYQLYDINFVS